MQQAMSVHVFIRITHDEVFWAITGGQRFELHQEKRRRAAERDGERKRESKGGEYEGRKREQTGHQNTKTVKKRQDLRNNLQGASK